MGDWEGRPWHKIEVDNPDEYAAFMNDPWKNPYLGGESYSVVLNRIQPVLMKLLKDHPDKTIAVVAHQVVNRSFIAETMNIDRPSARSIKQSNTGINVFNYNHDDNELNVVSVNGDFHLRDIDRPVD